jgi:hypothetical protein
MSRIPVILALGALVLWANGSSSDDKKAQGLGASRKSSRSR